MYLVSPAIYEDMAQQLREEIGDSSYYSGVIESSFIDDYGQNIEYRLITSLIIYRTPLSAPDGDSNPISNIVPVWIEFHIFVEMEEKSNDLDTSELKKYICQWS